jgi:hypothetical protein
MATSPHCHIPRIAKAHARPVPPVLPLIVSLIAPLAVPVNGLPDVSG